MRQQQRTVEGGEGEATVDLWVDDESERLVVLLSHIVDRPEGASGPAAIEFELGATAPLVIAAERVAVATYDAVDLLTERFAANPLGLLEWVRDLPESEHWSHSDVL